MCLLRWLLPAVKLSSRKGAKRAMNRVNLLGELCGLARNFHSDWYHRGLLPADYCNSAEHLNKTKLCCCSACAHLLGHSGDRTCCRPSCHVDFHLVRWKGRPRRYKKVYRRRISLTLPQAIDWNPLPPPIEAKSMNTTTLEVPTQLYQKMQSLADAEQTDRRYSLITPVGA